MDLQDIYSLETINSHSTLTGGINKVILFPSKIASERHKCKYINVSALFIAEVHLAIKLVCKHSTFYKI